jgi:hypothetical protein
LTTQAPPLRQSRDTFGGVATFTKMFKFSQILKTKHGISDAPSGETVHLKKAPMENICVNAAYIMVQQLQKCLNFHKYSKRNTEFQMHLQVKLSPEEGTNGKHMCKCCLH